MKKLKKSDLYLFIGIVLLFVIIIIGYRFYQSYYSNYNYLKLDRSKHLVYNASKDQYGNFYQYRPMVNIKDELGDIINKDINDYLDNFTKEDVSITYEYDLSGKILSLILKVEDHSFVESTDVLYYRAYNVNLDTLEILPNDTVIGYYELSYDDINTVVNNKLNEYYNELVNRNLIDNSCNYNCFIKTRFYNESIDDIEYFIRDGKLVLFKPHVYISSTDSDESDNFEIIV